MTGSAERLTSSRRPLARPAHRYVAVDGGAGAHLLTALTGAHPLLQEAASPRHADLLVVATPVAPKLLPSLAEIARAMPQPAGALIVGPAQPAIADLLPDADYVEAQSHRDVLDRLLSRPVAPLRVQNPPPLIEETISLPAQEARPLATEPLVLSLGPVQPFTAGPLRLLLVCDGEQVERAEVVSGYAHRDLASLMLRSSWPSLPSLAEQLDPLAPVAGRLAFARAAETLLRRHPAAAVESQREAALALERAGNHLSWLTRFAGVLAAPDLVQHSAELLRRLGDLEARLWPGGAARTIAPLAGPPLVDDASAGGLAAIAREAETLRSGWLGNRLLRLRTVGIGAIPAEHLEHAGVSGPVMDASQHTAGDVHGRLTVRLNAVIADLHATLDRLGTAAEESWDSGRSTGFDVPAGTAEATVRGPRGPIGLRLTSDGGPTPFSVELIRPSARLLPLLPDLLAGQKLADAEVIVASLDLAMAEADG